MVVRYIGFNPFGADIGTSEIADSSITAVKLATDAVETAKIKDASITLLKMANDSVGSSKIVNDAVDKDKLGILTTKGDTLIYSTEPARLPVGTNDQVMTADSAQALGMKWATASAGGGKLELIEHSTLSAVTSVTFSSITGYKYLCVVFNFNVSVNATNITMEFNGETGTRYHYLEYVGTTFTTSTNQAGARLFKSYEAGAHGGMIIIGVEEGGSSKHNPIACMFGGTFPSAGEKMLSGTFTPVTNVDITSIKILNSSGNMTGNITLYGIKET